MCAIAGIVHHKGPAQLGPWLERMAAHQAHRGPDDEGYLMATADQVQAFSGQQTLPEVAARATGPISATGSLECRWGLAHRRLSIFDTSAAGHQPMSLPTERGKGLHIVFNGAIYNYIELRTELEGLGERFVSGTDTEVILAGYRQWQERLALKMEGMWALAIVDEANDTLFCSRDRLGVKPFYFVNTPQAFAFASEQKALYDLPFTSRKLSQSAMFDFLVLGEHERQPSGMVKAVEELPAGHHMTVTLSSLAIKTWEYYAPTPSLRWESYKRSNHGRYKEKVREALAEAVRLRLRSDVPLGACLSGGLDSSLLVCLADGFLRRGESPYRGLDVFTATFPGEDMDEGPMAQLTVEKAHALWHPVTPTGPELEADLADFFYTHDLPLQTPSTYAQYRVMQAANEAGVKITLDGQGADELFAGYASHFQAFFPQLIQRRELGQIISQWQGATSNFANKGQVLRAIGRRLAARFLSKDYREKMFRAKFGEYSMLRSSFWEGNHRRLTEHLDGPPPGLNQLLSNHLSGPVMRTHLRLADRNSMRWGIEARVPFADAHHLIDMVVRIPPVYKIREGRSKALLRSAARGLVPKAIIDNRTKTGFEGPNHAWMAHLEPILREAMRQPGMEEYVHINRIQQNWDSLWAEAQAGSPLRLWRMASLGLWLQHVYK